MQEEENIFSFTTKMSLNTSEFSEATVLYDIQNSHCNGISFSVQTF